jgi:hypothetical protein
MSGFDIDPTKKYRIQVMDEPDGVPVPSGEKELLESLLYEVRNMEPSLFSLYNLYNENIYILSSKVLPQPSDDYIYHGSLIGLIGLRKNPTEFRFQLLQQEQEDDVTEGVAAMSISGPGGRRKSRKAETQKNKKSKTKTKTKRNFIRIKRPKKMSHISWRRTECI